VRRLSDLARGPPGFFSRGLPELKTGEQTSLKPLRGNCPMFAWGGKFTTWGPPRRERQRTWPPHFCRVTSRRPHSRTGPSRRTALLFERLLLPENSALASPRKWVVPYLWRSFRRDDDGARGVSSKPSHENPSCYTNPFYSPSLLPKKYPVECSDPTMGRLTLRANSHSPPSRCPVVDWSLKCRSFLVGNRFLSGLRLLPQI